MSKKPSLPEPDYQNLWTSYNKWQQEDKMWYDSAKAEQEQGADVSNITAQMARSGMAAGTPEWEANIKRVTDARPDIDAEYAARQKELTDSVVYEDLHRKYSGEEGRRKDGWAKEMYGTDMWGMANKPATANEGMYVDSSLPLEERRVTNPMTGGYNRNMTEDEAMAANPFEAQSFEDWGAQNYGSATVKNPYETEVSAADASAAVAKTAARGRAPGSAGTGASIAKLEKNPWM